MATKYSPKIITNGLVLSLDAANNKSYPRSGTTWTDLSGNSNTGTLTNGPSFNGANGGSIVFDGVDDYISGTNNSSLQLLNDLTIGAWVKLGSGGNANQGIFEKMVNTGYSGYGITRQDDYFKFWTGSGGTFAYTNSNITYSSGNNWYYVVGRRMAGNNRLFINSILQTDSQSPPLSDSGEVYVIGRYYSNIANTFYFVGNIAHVLLYNRALTDAEILQNYNVNKSRFGL